MVIMDAEIKVNETPARPQRTGGKPSVWPVEPHLIHKEPGHDAGWEARNTGKLAGLTALATIAAWQAGQHIIEIVTFIHNLTGLPIK